MNKFVFVSTLIKTFQQTFWEIKHGRDITNMHRTIRQYSKVTYISNVFFNNGKSSFDILQNTLKHFKNCFDVQSSIFINSDK